MRLKAAILRARLGATFALLLGLLAVAPPAHANKFLRRMLGFWATKAQSEQGKPPGPARTTNDRPLRADDVRLYRGTSSPGKPQVSHAMRDTPTEQVPSGETEFMSLREAREHAFHGRGYHPDGVSVTTDARTAAKFGTHTIEYRIPRTVFERLPAGDPAQAELVFKHSIPEKYVTGVQAH
jgi:hypothetical protein